MIMFHSKGLPIVMTIEKIMIRRQGTIYPSEKIIRREKTKEEEYEKFFTPLESRRSLLSNCHANAMKDLT